MFRTWKSIHWGVRWAFMDCRRISKIPSSLSNLSQPVSSGGERLQGWKPTSRDDESMSGFRTLHLVSYHCGGVHPAVLRSEGSGVSDDARFPVWDLLPPWSRCCILFQTFCTKRRWEMSGLWPHMWTNSWLKKLWNTQVMVDHHTCTHTHTHTCPLAITAHGCDMQVVKRQVQLTSYVWVCASVSTEVTTTTKH